MTAESGVALRVAELCLDRRGRLSTLLISSTAVRAGLLVDLALAGRLSEDEDGIDLDASPTGHRPTDLLLREVVAHPGTSLDGWLERPRPTLRDVAEEAVGSGRWQLRRGPHLAPRFAVVHAERCELGSHAAAAVVAIAGAAALTDGAGRRGEVPSSELLDAAGPHRWLVGCLADHLLELGTRYAADAGMLRATSYPPQG